MKSIKIIVLGFLQNLSDNKYEQFNKAFELYKQLPNKSHQFEARYNRSGFTEDGLKNLLYDLKTLNGITDLELHSPVDANEIEVKEEEVLDFKELNDFPESSEDAKLANKLFDHIEMPENAPEGYKVIPGEELTPIREEFPYLNDADCPEIIYVVVGKRIAAHKRYQELHAIVQQIAEKTFEGTEDEKKEIVTLCDAAFTENSLLWNELNHYKETGELLGKHKLFTEVVAKREVDLMTNEELAKYRTSSATFLSKKRAALKKAKSDAEKQKLNQAIDDRQYRLNLVNTRLGIADGK
jgi:hypothetical protein